VVGQFVFILSGFLLPRLVYDRVGMEMLGVWDFGWTLVAHLMLVGAGMLSAVSREVAQFTGRGDVAELRAVISSCFALFTLLGLVVLITAGAIAGFLPILLPSLSAEALPAARWVMILLGTSAAVRFPFHVFNGIITGHQRYVAHNVIVSGTHLVTVLGLLALVVSGHGVAAMAGLYLVGELAAGCLKVHYALRLCPHASIAPRYVCRETIRHIFSFGGKTFLASISRVMLYQTNAMLVGFFMGVEALAVFARPRALLRCVETVITKVAVVFTPRASYFQACDDHAALERSVHQATQFCLYLALPSLLLLIILGDRILELWMGGPFAQQTLMIILAAGHLAAFAQRGAFQVLMGMARHGRPALADFIGSAVGIGLTALLVGVFDWGLVGAALGMVVPMTLVNVLVVPTLAGWALGVPPMRLYLSAAALPGLLSLPFAAVLALGRVIGPVPAGLSVIVSVPPAALIYGLLLWAFALTPEQRRRFARKLPVARCRATLRA